MKSATFKFCVTLEFSRHHCKLKLKHVFIVVSNTSQLIGLVHFIINDWNYLAFWKKLALNQVLRFESVSVYIGNSVCICYCLHSDSRVPFVHIVNKLK